ncbi:MAG: glycosyltransferase [Pseudohongiella sp.]|uniref:glycosyltransferase family 2 protein n=1 Tax=Pseudohongiella sp. TaxID=1979412 RepID=UPI0034A01493
MIVCIFSFNRGRFLQHCVSSVERCAPDWKICVIDDGSQDAETVSTLETIARRHQVLHAQSSAGRKHGGLYANMQLALEKFVDEPLMLTLQDDMQMVRPLEADDVPAMQDYFRDNPQSAFLQPCFLKGATRQRDVDTLRFDSQSQVYLRAPAGQSAGVHYSDILVTQPARLQAAGWQFAHSEPANDRQAAQLFGPMGHLFSPFVMWLPEVPAYRGKRKTLALKIAEARRKCGLYPFATLNAEQIRMLKQRRPEQLPFAEDYLANTEPDLSQPWAYYPLQDSRWLKKLNSLELTLRRLLP